MTVFSVGLAEAALAELARFTSAVTREWEASQDPALAIQAVSRAANVYLPATAISYVCRSVQIGDEPNEAGAAKLSLAVLSLVRASEVFKLLSYAARATYRRYVSLLSPFVQEEDLLDEVRQRLWSASTDRFSPAGFLKNPGIVGYLARIAQRAALDHIRRNAARVRKEAWVVQQAQAVDGNEEPKHSIDDLMNEALRQAGEHLSPDARRVFPDILAEVISRREGLQRINQERAGLGLAPWSEAVLRNALFRYRARVREAFTAMISEDSD